MGSSKSKSIKVDINGMFHDTTCRASWTVKMASDAICKKYGLQHGCLEDDNGMLLDEDYIKYTIGNLFYKGGQLKDRGISLT